MIVRNVRVNGKDAIDIAIGDGRIAAMGPGLRADGDNVVDGRGMLALPPFVETHIHLDKILWGLPWTPNCSGPTLKDMIENEKRIRRTLQASVEQRAGNLIRQCVAMGSTFIRSHVDVDPDYGLSNLHGVVAAHERHKHAVDLEIVAFPQVGILRSPGTAKLLDAAVAEGAAVVGGLDPAGIDGDPVEHLDIIFGIADRRGAKVDIHLHDPGDLGLYELQQICERTRALGLGGRVNVSHAFCLGTARPDRLRAAADELANSGVSIITAAPGDLAMPPVDALRAAGVQVACGSDAIRDTWTPFGNGDMLERAMLVAYRSGYRKDEQLESALDLATTAAATLVGISGYGLEVGAEGSLVLLAAETRAEAVVSRPRERIVIKKGKVVARDSRWIGD
jgi:cytosine/adenosine deaminase-related metal-dependent hydrolase